MPVSLNIAAIRQMCDTVEHRGGKALRLTALSEHRAKFEIVAEIDEGAIEALPADDTDLAA